MNTARMTVMGLLAVAALTSCGGGDPQAASPAEPSRRTSTTPSVPQASASSTPTATPVAPSPTPSVTAAPSVTVAKPRSRVVRGLPTANVNRGSAGEVAGAYLRTVWAWDTLVDDSPDGAGRRAAVYTAAPLRTSLLSGGSRSAGAAFAAAQAAGGGYAVVTSLYELEAEEPGADSTQLEVAFEVTLEVRDQKGRTVPSGEPSAISNLTLVRTAGVWSVTRDEAA